MAGTQRFFHNCEYLRAFRLCLQDFVSGSNAERPESSKSIARYVRQTNLANHSCVNASLGVPLSSKTEIRLPTQKREAAWGWRRRWDSNPRNLAVRLISSQVHSTGLCYSSMSLSSHRPSPDAWTLGRTGGENRPASNWMNSEKTKQIKDFQRKVSKVPTGFRDWRSLKRSLPRIRSYKG